MDKDELYARIMQETLTQRNGCGQPMIAMMIFVIVLLFSSCATKTKMEYRDRVVDHYITNTVHDTLVDKTTDSVYLEVMVKGDTVYQTKYKEKTRWRDRIVEKHDTCWRDSDVTEYKEIAKEVVKYPKTYWYSVGISVLFFIFAFIKLFKKFI